MLLNSVKECGGDWTCLDATQFDWTTTQLNLNGTGSAATFTGPAEAASDLKVVDLNGDGKSDRISHVSGSGASHTWRVCLGPLTTACSTYTINSYGDSGSPDRWLVADIEGSGKASLITYQESTST